VYEVIRQMAAQLCMLISTRDSVVRTTTLVSEPRQSTVTDGRRGALCQLT